MWKCISFCMYAVILNICFVECVLYFYCCVCVCCLLLWRYHYPNQYDYCVCLAFCAIITAFSPRALFSSSLRLPLLCNLRQKKNLPSNLTFLWLYVPWIWQRCCFSCHSIYHFIRSNCISTFSFLCRMTVGRLTCVRVVLDMSQHHILSV